jgi:hypothetical protein
MSLKCAGLNYLANQCLGAFPKVASVKELHRRNTTWLAGTALIKEKSNVNFK